MAMIVPLTPKPPRRPELWLLKADDVLSPMQDALDALTFVGELVTTLSHAALRDPNSSPFSEASWSFLWTALAEPQRELERALARVKSMPGDLLVPDGRFGMLEVCDMFLERRDREAAEGSTTPGDGDDHAA